MEKQNNQEIFTKYMNVLLQDKLPVGEFDFHKLNIPFHEVSFLVSNLDDFIGVFSLTALRKGQIIAKLCELIVGFSLVSNMSVQEKELQAEDFPCTAHYAENCFTTLKLLLHTWEYLENSDRRHIFINVLLLCATHSEKYPWSSENAVCLSTDLLAHLLSLSNHKDLSSLLCDDFHPTIYKGVLKKLRPSLMKDTWLHYPSSCYVFSWFLHHVKHPYLSDYLCDIFPPPCMFISDHISCHQKLAIQCFHHILDNVPPTLIKLDGKEDVIWNLLSPFLYSTEEEIIGALSPCLLQLPAFRSQKMTQICWSYYDDSLNQLLIRAEMEFAKKLKSLYLSHIYSFIQITPPFKHLKHLLRVIEESFYKDTDIECHIKSLKILETIIKSCWPSMEKYCFKILKSIAILFCECEKKKSEIESRDIQELHDVCENCLTLLKYACHEEFENLITKYVKEGNDMPGVKIFDAVLQKK